MVLPDYLSRQNSLSLRGNLRQYYPRQTAGDIGSHRSLSPPLPSAILSPRRDFFRLGSEWRLFLFCPVLTWQWRGFRVRSAAAVASTSLPALRGRSVGVQPPLLVKHWGGGGCFQTLGWKVDKTQTLGVSGLLPLLTLRKLTSQK